MAQSKASSHVQTEEKITKPTCIYYRISCDGRPKADISEAYKDRVFNDRIYDNC